MLNLRRSILALAVPLVLTGHVVWAQVDLDFHHTAAGAESISVFSHPGDFSVLQEDLNLNIFNDSGAAWQAYELQLDALFPDLADLFGFNSFALTGSNFTSNQISGDFHRLVLSGGNQEAGSSFLVSLGLSHNVPLQFSGTPLFAPVENTGGEGGGTEELPPPPPGGEVGGSPTCEEVFSVEACSGGGGGGVEPENPDWWNLKSGTKTENGVLTGDRIVTWRENGDGTISYGVSDINGGVGNLVFSGDLSSFNAWLNDYTSFNTNEIEPPPPTEFPDDDGGVSPGPEPAEWLMLSLGLGLVVWRVSRQRRSVIPTLAV